MTDLYLASSSPRRQQLLRQLGVVFQTITFQADEPEFKSLGNSRINVQQAVDFVFEVVEWKLAQAAEIMKLSPIPILAADTLIFHHGRVLEKPKSRTNAFEMLSVLAGSTHQVITVVALKLPNRHEYRLSRSEVTFTPLSKEQINGYLDTGEYQGKAGAYAVQGYAAAFISMLKGSYSGVMGLPLHETVELLHDFGIAYWKRP